MFIYSFIFLLSAVLNKFLKIRKQIIRDAHQDYLIYRGARKEHWLEFYGVTKHVRH